MALVLLLGPAVKLIAHFIIKERRKHTAAATMLRVIARSVSALASAKSVETAVKIAFANGT
jgi:hypothetical protein